MAVQPDGVVAHDYALEHWLFLSDAMILMYVGSSMYRTDFWTIEQRSSDSPHAATPANDQICQMKIEF